MQPLRSPGQRAGLTHARVLAAARELLAESGFEALTMRGLALRLDVSPNSLYSHVENKTALIDDVLDDVLSEVKKPGSGIEDPSASLHAIMASTHEVLLAHADLVPLFLARQGARGPNAQGLGEIVLNLLSREGVEGPRAREALRVLIVYTIGFTAFATQAPLMPKDQQEPSTGELARNFDSGLRWLLSGIAGPH
jgi:TetR/AcrR family transcriptional regulator, tetracycline repressor protein